jgi:hypothetical protein
VVVELSMLKKATRTVGHSGRLARPGLRFGPARLGLAWLQFHAVPGCIMGRGLSPGTARMPVIHAGPARYHIRALHTMPARGPCSYEPLHLSRIVSTMQIWQEMYWNLNTLSHSNTLIHTYTFKHTHTHRQKHTHPKFKHSHIHIHKFEKNNIY